MASDIQAVIAWSHGDLKEGSAEELEARRIIARLLRSSRPLNLGFRSMLADLIDPDDDVAEHRFVLKQRPGNRKRSADHCRIAVYVWRRVAEGAQIKAAAIDAMGHFRVKRSTVMAAWSKWKPHIERYPKFYAREESKKQA
jgi:hypothetical protein